jgi:hypothetical protein
MLVPVRKFLNSLDEKLDIQYRENIGKSSDDLVEVTQSVS